MASDRELLDAWSAGDRSAGNELFERYFAALYRFFANKLDRDVDELIQRTFLGCTEGRHAFRGDSSFRTFLFSIARRQLYRYWRTRARDDALDFGVSSIMDLTPRPSRVVAERREQQLLLAALRAIPVDLQIAVELYYWEGLSGSELAAVLDVPEGTVRSRLRRAREALAARMVELAESREVADAALVDFDSWARSLRDCATATTGG